MRKLVVAGAVITLVAGVACGNDDNKDKGSSAAPKTNTVGVQVDAKSTAFAAAFTAYFPNEVKVHPGDTVQFTEVFTGEPHSVVLGTLVQNGLTAYDTASAGKPPDSVDESTIPELAKIPDMLPDGPGDANQSTAQPCFLATGDPPGPGATACPKVAQPDFDGTQTVYSSGFLPDKATFDVKLASTIKPGTYRYMCALHRTSMQGKITVVAAGAAADTAATAKAAGDAAIQKSVAALQPVVTAANAATPDKAAAGLGAETAQDALATVFAPKDVSVPVGGSVTWTVFGPHTITFNATEALRTFISKAPDGAVHLNPQSFTPANSPGQPEQQGEPKAGPPKVVDAGKFDGTGLKNTGIILSFPPQLTAFKVTFTKAGTYQVRCLIHPDMEGSVKVG